MIKDKILVVDDDPFFKKQIIDILTGTNKNFAFLQANNGNVAFKIAKFHQSEKEVLMYSVAVTVVYIVFNYPSSLERFISFQHISIVQAMF